MPTQHARQGAAAELFGAADYVSVGYFALVIQRGVQNYDATGLHSGGIAKRGSMQQLRAGLNGNAGIVRNGLRGAGEGEEKCRGAESGGCGANDKCDTGCEIPSRHTSLLYNR